MAETSPPVIFFDLKKFFVSSLCSFATSELINCYVNLSGHSAVAQSVERPLKGLVWCNSTEMGSNRARRHVITLITPRHEVVGKSYQQHLLHK